MGLLCQGSSWLRSWILSALCGLMSFAALFMASGASPLSPLLSGGVLADAQLEAQYSSMDAQAPKSDASQGEPDPDMAPSAGAQRRPLGPPPPPGGPRSVEGEQSPIVLTRKQKGELLKSEFEKMKQDAAELASLAQSLQEDLGKSNEHILSLKVVEKARKIESLAKKISKTARNY